LQETPIIFVFPAFPNELTDPPGKNIPGFGDHFQTLLDTALKSGLTGLPHNFFTGTFLTQDELLTQFISYIYSCTVSETLRSNNFTPVVSAGYSMGIYAALFDAGSVTFTDGIELIRCAYHSLAPVSRDPGSGMITVIGLSRDDLGYLIKQQKLRCRIINENAPFSFSLSGRSSDLRILADTARNEGALHVRFLGVSLPYHAAFAETGARKFMEETAGIPFVRPANPVISLIDQSLLTDPESMRAETVRNLFTPLNWHHTMLKIHELHPGCRFVECGLPTGLPKNAKFVAGDLRFYSFQDFCGNELMLS